MRTLLLASLIGCTVALMLACGGGDEEPRATATAASEGTGDGGVQLEESRKGVIRVLQVKSGTSIQIDRQGGQLDVRYIGLLQPDADLVDENGVSLRQAAYDFNRSLVENKDVELEKGAVERDLLGTLYRYVYVDGLMVNKEIVAQGFATVRDEPTDTRYQEELLAAQEEAKANGRGLWAASRSGE